MNWEFSPEEMAYERKMCNRWHEICDVLEPLGLILNLPYVPFKLMALDDEEFSVYLSALSSETAVGR